VSLVVGSISHILEACRVPSLYEVFEYYSTKPVSRLFSLTAPLVAQSLAHVYSSLSVHLFCRLALFPETGWPYALQISLRSWLMRVLILASMPGFPWSMR